MKGLTEVIYMAQEKEQGRDGVISKMDQWAAVFEATLVSFFIALIPELIVLDGPPSTLGEVWKPFLIAMLMALYTYSRARGIQLPDEVNDGG